MSSLNRPELPKRFYTAVSVVTAEGGGFSIELDGRGLRTPLRRKLVVPTRALAALLASEWEAQKERIDPATMPLTRLANTVIDGIADDPGSVRADLAGYIETDMLFYRAGYPERLVERQRAAWDPIIAEAERRIGSRFVLAEGVMHAAQPPASIAAFRQRIDAVEDPFAVAALHQMTTLTGSALLPLGIAEGWLDADLAWEAAHVDEDWNIGLWGGDAEAEARRAARYADMRAAVILLQALAPESGDDAAGHFPQEAS
ncbi:ATPase [Aureimonas sp. SA4125]|uniref:ATP12 family chaperone protein n=1 Tax=Aureimonas sp. SA4125 TaxID=2826993 RepID=UPI001CC814B3|nr:ATP12 family protein [Aureimonas sp. SA4125]BDA84768.1 ATPase [Aureimonas sp. SA4125]